MRGCGKRATIALVLVGLLAGSGCQPSGGSTTPGPGGRTSSAPVSSPTPSDAASPTPTERTPGIATCAALAAGMELEQRIGQLMMVAVDSTGLGSATADTLDDVHAGSVLLLGNTDAGRKAVMRVTDEVRAAIRPPAGIGVLLAADQEGGQVQRLSGKGFDRIPSAAKQADLSDGELRERAEKWGKQLKKAGIDVNLAPVADVVPKELADDNEPIAGLDRGYGSDPEEVGAKVAAFTEGMADAEVATALKHFPGLGRVRGNTDFTSKVVDRSTTDDDPGFASFRAGIDAGADMIMIANAYYDKIDDDRQAVFSKKIVTGLVRDRLGFTGVVISDDLAAAGVADVRPGRRATRFIGAGGDLMIIGDPDEAEEMAEALAEKAEDDTEFDARITESVIRVLALKSRHGLASCSA